MVTEHDDFNPQAMLEERQFSDVTTEIHPFDLNILNDPQYTALYINEIFDYLKVQEVSNNRYS